MNQLFEQQWQQDQCNISKIIQIPQQIHSTIRNHNLIITQKQFPATIFHVTSIIINDFHFQFFISIHYFLCEINLIIQTTYDLSLFWYLFKLFVIKLKINYNEDELLQLIQILIAKDLIKPIQVFSHSFSIIKLIPQLQEFQVTQLFSMFPTIQPILFQCNSKINQIIFNQIDFAKLKIIDMSHSSLASLEILKDICIQFTSINISNCKQLTSNHLVSFFTNNFCNLVDLNIESNCCEDDVFETIWNNRSMNKLTNLNYGNCQIHSPSRIASLFAQINMKQNQILKLNLSNTSINNEILVAIQWLEKLQILDISKNPQIISLFDLKREKSYEYLNISHCSISKHEMDQFLLQSYLNNTILVMHGIQLNQTQFNKQLRGLHFDGNAKFDSINLPTKLQQLSLLGECNLYFLHQSFTNNIQFQFLNELDLSKLAIDDQIVKLISELKKLQKLVLNGCKMITDNGIKNLKDNLLHLELNETNITDIGLQLMKPIVLCLDILSIRECYHLSEWGIKDLFMDMCSRKRRLKIYISGQMGM